MQIEYFDNFVRISNGTGLSMDFSYLWWIKQIAQWNNLVKEGWVNPS